MGNIEKVFLVLLVVRCSRVNRACTFAAGQGRRRGSGVW